MHGWRINFDPGPAEAYVSELVQRGDLVQTDQGWVPRNLTLPQAVAHVLADRPEGLSWQTILALIDERGLRRRDTHLDRLAAYDSRWVYLYGRGIYRHVRYSTLGGPLLIDLLREVRSYLERNGLRSANLRVVAAVLERRPGVDYYELRRAVREFGAYAGLSFDGQSGVDTVALGAPRAVPRVRVRDVVQQILTEASSPQSNEEIVAALEHGSASNVRVKLQELSVAGIIVRVPSGWTTLERALDGIDDTVAADYDDELSKRTDKVLHIDAIREWLDPAIGTELPIRVWLGVVRRHAQRRGWIVQGDLVARRPFPWSKLRDLVREHVRPGLSNQAIVARIREDALLSRRVAEGVRLRAAIADERAKRSRKG